MVKKSARNKGADPVESQRREDVLRRGRRGVFSEEDTADDAHTVAGDAIKGYPLVLFVDLDNLFGRTCVSVFHAISTASLPAREGFRCAPIQTVLCQLTPKPEASQHVTRTPRSRKIVDGQPINAVAWGPVQERF